MSARTAAYPITSDTPRETAEAIRSFMGRFDLNSVDMADFLGTPGSDSNYPTSGLIRNMLTGEQMPSERFLHLLHVRLAEVEEQLAAGIQTLTIGARVRRIFRVTRRLHIATILRADELDFEERDTDDVVEAIRAAESVPSSWVHRCLICERVFVARSSRQIICRRQDETGRFPCVRENAKRMRAHRKRLDQEYLAQTSAPKCA